MKKALIPLFSLIILFSLGTTLVYANTHTDVGGDNSSDIGGPNPGPSLNFELKNPFRVGDTLFELLNVVVNNIILPIGGVLAVLAFIYSGFLYVMAQGKPEALNTANKALLYTAIGTAVLLGSWMLSGVIRVTVNQIIN